MVTSGRCPILKSVSGRLESSQPANCVAKKKWVSQKKNMWSGGRTGMCKSWISNWSWCPPTERDMCTRTHTHRHTYTPPLDSSCTLPPPNSTSTKWNLSVTGARRPSFTPYWNKLDPHRGHAHTDVQSLRQKRGWWKDEDRTERCCRLLFPAATLGLISPCYASPCSLPHAATPLSLFLFYFLTLGLTPPSLSISLSSSIHERLYSISVSQSSSCFSLKSQESFLFFPP